MRDALSTALKLLLVILLLAVGIAVLDLRVTSRCAHLPATRNCWRKGMSVFPRS